MSESPCTFGIPPDKCGKPAVATVPGDSALFFCEQHARIARAAFTTLIELGVPKQSNMSCGTYIIFSEREPKPKTKVWAVLSSGGPEIGSVGWYGPWRKYCFMPAPNTVFEQVCLREIAHFCEEETKRHKSK